MYLRGFMFSRQYTCRFHLFWHASLGNWCPTFR